VVVALGLAVTLSRGAALAYVSGASWIVASARVRHGWRWVAAGAACVILIVAIVGSERLTDSGSGGATSSRELIWSSSLNMVRDHPLTGVGLDQFLNQYGRRYVEPAGWPERYTSHPHNIVLDFWLRLGVAGLICLSALVALAGWLVRRSLRRDRDRALVIGASAALIAGAVHGLVDNGFFLADLAIMTWLMIAVLETTAEPSSPRWDDAD
jgi:O-antigen ligase